jgi:hypothetical protein
MGDGDAAVAQIFNLLFRRVALGRASGSSDVRVNFAASAD